MTSKPEKKISVIKITAKNDTMLAVGKKIELQIQDLLTKKDRTITDLEKPIIRTGGTVEFELKT